ncbi:MAG: FAD-dependent oxidoreductase [Candidatus Anammoxibacter sp.]
MRQYKISNVFQQTLNVKVLQLELLHGEDVSFLPGQHIDVSFTDDKEILSGIYNNFSISSSTVDKKSLEIVVPDLGGFRNKLYNASPGTILNVNGPYGEFIYIHNPEYLPVFIAGGSGIAPIMSMIRHVNTKYPDTPFTLFYTCKTENDIIFFNELNDIKRANMMFEFYLFTTRSGSNEPELENDYNNHLPVDKIGSYELAESNIHRIKGYINESAIINNIKGISSRIYYICGPYEMTVMVTFILQKLRVSHSKIKSELW